MNETKRAKCVSVAHAGIAEGPKGNETSEIGDNTESAEGRGTEDTERCRRGQYGLVGAESSPSMLPSELRASRVKVHDS
jgi:hypothetical protein